MSQTMPVLGRVVTNQSGIVATRIAERIEKLEVRIGDRVEKGAVLARLSSDQLEQSLRLKKAELSRAKAIGEKSNAEFKKKEQARQRIIALRGSTAFRQDRDQNSQRDLEMAAGSLKEAEAEVARAEAALNMAQQFLRDTLIKAPYSGIIISTHIVPGSYTRTGDPIVTMLNDDDLEIDVVYLYTFTDIPSVFQRYIIAKASARAAAQLITNPQLVQLLQTQEGLTRASVVDYECNQGDHSFMGFPHESSYDSYKPFKSLIR